MMDAMASALAGLRAATTRTAARADNIANLQTDGYRQAVPVQTTSPAGPEVRVVRPGPAQRVDPVTGLIASEGSVETDIVDLVMSKVAYKASAKILRSADEMTGSLLDSLA